MHGVCAVFTCEAFDLHAQGNEQCHEQCIAMNSAFLCNVLRGGVTVEAFDFCPVLSQVVQCE